jgi:lysophospholipase L1-like esterase
MSNGGGTVATKDEAISRSAPVYIGRRSDGAAGSGLIRSIRYFPTAYTGATLQALALYPQSVNKFVSFGDSMAAGAGASVNANRWPNLLSVSMNPDGYLDYRAAGGTTSSDMLVAFNADDKPEHRTWINLFWTGHNSANAAQTVSDTQACVAQLTGEKKYLVLLTIITDSEPLGGLGQAELIATRNGCLAAFPNRCVDIPAALAAANNGSAQDLSDVANGWTPTSLQLGGSAIHLNDQGQIVVHNAVAAKLNALGWSTYIPPPYVPIP